MSLAMLKSNFKIGNSSGKFQWSSTTTSERAISLQLFQNNTIMSLTHRTLTRASALGKRLAAPTSARNYANYPFTFPNDSTVTPQASDAATSAPKSPYPFTNKPGTPDRGSPVAPQASEANRGRAGDNEPEHMKESELMLNQEGEYHQMDMTSRQPDYNAAADYRTS
jgi:hypothetical protein